MEVRIRAHLSLLAGLLLALGCPDADDDDSQTPVDDDSLTDDDSSADDDDSTGDDDTTGDDDGSDDDSAENGWVDEEPVVVFGVDAAVAVYLGPSPNCHAGSAVGVRGDLNQDGLSDIAVGGPASSTGVVFLLYGPHAGQSSLSVSDVEIQSEPGNSQFGAHLDIAGDANGDGFDDLLVGATEWGEQSGRAYLFNGPLHGLLNAVDADAIVTGGVGHEQAGRVSFGGDLDGDGFDEVLVGAPGADHGGENGGAVYVFYGPVEGSLLTGDADVRIIGGSDDRLGYPGAAGDIDGDALDDLLIASPFYSGVFELGGAVHVFTQFTAMEMNIAEATAVLLGESTFYVTGESFAAADVSGDGLSDLIIGAPRAPGYNAEAGTGYLVDGPVSGEVNLATVPNTLGGHEWFQYVGAGAATGDLDGDGVGDFIAGGPGSHDVDENVVGSICIEYGPIAGQGMDLNCDVKIMGNTIWDGHPSEYFMLGFGSIMDSGGDVDGDDLDEIVVGMPTDNDGGYKAGAVYVFSGSYISSS